MERLKSGMEIPAFTCADSDLDDFLREDAVPSSEQMLTVTYLFQKGGTAIAFFSVLNDNVTTTDFKDNEKIMKAFLKKKGPAPDATP